MHKEKRLYVSEQWRNQSSAKETKTKSDIGKTISELNSIISELDETKSELIFNNSIYPIRLKKSINNNLIVTQSKWKAKSLSLESVA
jgi:hypothetical protein